MPRHARFFVPLAGLAMLWAAAASAQETVKIAYIDPLSGAFANVGEQGLKHFRYMAELLNSKGGLNGKPIEIVALDNKTDPKESLIQLQKAIDQGARFIAQGNGSSVASAIIDAVNKHNERNPAAPVVYLNYAAVEPSFTNDRCSFWHFRFDADADMKMEAVTDWLVTQPQIKKIYILGQDYSFGKAVAAAAQRMIKAKRPDIAIVGDELHPLGKVKDFSPYIAKMKAAGADAVITGNWGNDMSLLIKASADAGFNVPYLTFYGGGLGTPAAMGRAGIGLVKQITDFHNNVETLAGKPLDPFIDDFEKKTAIEFYFFRIKTAMEMLAVAASKAGSNDPVKVAFALEGLEHETELGRVTMRRDNHQLLQPMFLSTFGEKTRRDVEKTGLGFKTDFRVEAEKTAAQTTCKMERPKP